MERAHATDATRSGLGHGIKGEEGVEAQDQNVL
jgi:hypothetical protein